MLGDGLASAIILRCQQHAFINARMARETHHWLHIHVPICSLEIHIEAVNLFSHTIKKI